MWCSNNCKCSVWFLLLQEFCSSHINQVNLSCMINYGIFWFYVSVNDSIWVKVLYRKQKWSKKVTGNWLIQRRKLSDDTEKLNTFDVLHQEINIFFIWKCLHKSNNERELNFLKNSSLLLNVNLQTFFFYWIFWNLF